MAGATGHSGKSLAGATEQSHNLDPLMTVAFMNIGIMQSAFEGKNSTKHLAMLTTQVDELVGKHSVKILCVVEVGTRREGLQQDSKRSLEAAVREGAAMHRHCGLSFLWADANEAMVALHSTLRTVGIAALQRRAAARNQRIQTVALQSKLRTVGAALLQRRLAERCHQFQSVLLHSTLLLLRRSAARGLQLQLMFLQKMLVEVSATYLCPMRRPAARSPTIAATTTTTSPRTRVGKMRIR